MAEISRAEILNLPIDRQACFADHQGRQSDKIQAAQTKTLGPLMPYLKAVLKPEETILCSAKASTEINPIEHLLTGWAIYYLKACVMVATSQRLLCFRTYARGRPNGSVSQIAYGDLKEAKVGGWLTGTLALKYKKGGPETETFANIQGGDAKKLKAILPDLLKAGQPSPEGRRWHLCPRCAAALLRDRFSCPSCQLAFKTLEKATRRALLLPGGGYFYTGHKWFGVREVLAEGLFVIFILMMLMEMAMGKPGLPADLVFLALLGLLKLQAVVQARRLAREYLPEPAEPVRGRGR